MGLRLMWRVRRITSHSARGMVYSAEKSARKGPKIMMTELFVRALPRALTGRRGDGETGRRGDGETELFVRPASRSDGDL